ncbi:MAG: sugar phosphate isomerase/epimerase family protein [Pseudomonadota bacterium]
MNDGPTNAREHNRSRVRIGYTLWPGSFELTEPGAFLDEAEGLEVDTVEVPLFCTRLIANGRIIEPAMRWFEGHFSGRRQEVTSHAMLSINLMDKVELLSEHERIARANIEVSARLGARIMVLHCGLSDHADGTDGLEDGYARQRDALCRLAETAEDHGVTICVETIWSFDGRETALPSRLASEIEQVDHPAVSATLDFAHSALQCQIKGADLMSELFALAPHARHLHLNDCFGIEKPLDIALPSEASAYGSGDLHLPLGWGNLEWERMLTEPCFPPDVILNHELHPTYWYALPGEVRTLRTLAARMAEGD